MFAFKDIWFPAAYTGCNGLGSGLGSNVERGFDGMGILCVFCVYDTIGNRCFEKTSFPKIDPHNEGDSVPCSYKYWHNIPPRKGLTTEMQY